MVFGGPTLPTIADVFGNDLQLDPSFALSPVQIPIRTRSGPSHRLQFVIELVGPRTLSAGLAAVLVSPEWQKALGNPQSFVMSAADLEWRPLTADTAGSYDSLALAWDLVGQQGRLSKQSAAHLLQIAEGYGEQVQRKAMAMPLPDDVPKAISQLDQVVKNFDAGFSLLVLPQSRKVLEYELWVWCAQLGLQPNLTEGTFDWIVPGSPLPLFSVSPLGDSESFTLDGAKRGDNRDGVLLGFSIPRSPEPMAGLEGMFKAASFLADRMNGEVFDESNKPLSDAGRQTARTQLAEALEALKKLGFQPGSPDTLKLFS